MNRSLKHRHWAGLTEYTSPFGFALSYVFDKQSGSPCYCDLPLHSYEHSYRHPLYRRYRANMPSSLNQFSLSRLSLLSQGISVDSWYGLLHFMHKLFTGSRNQQLSLNTFIHFLSLRSMDFNAKASFQIPAYPKANSCTKQEQQVQEY